MSYILDALRRAQAERERGQVPGLEARTLVQTPPPPAPRRVMVWVLAGSLVAGLLALVALLALRGGPVPATVPVAAQPAPTPATPVPTPAPLPTSPPPIVVVSAPTVPPSPTAPATALSSTPLAPLAMPAPVAAPAPPVPAAGGVRAIQLAQLSADLRRELPALTLGGAIWSDNAASRFVIVNGQVLREGEAAAPGVLLERIGPKAVFLRWRDWRIEVPI